MNRKIQIIAFCLVGLFSVTCLVYAHIKANEAEENAIAARIAAERAIEGEKLAEEYQTQAREAAAEAITQMKRAERALIDCQGN